MERAWGCRCPSPKAQACQQTGALFGNFQHMGSQIMALEPYSLAWGGG